jgi:hypothetical protein
LVIVACGVARAALSWVGVTDDKTANAHGYLLARVT